MVYFAEDYYSDIIYNGADNIMWSINIILYHFAMLYIIKILHVLDTPSTS